MQNTAARRSFDARCIRFGVNVIELVDHFPKDARGKHLSNQVMRSGTSIGANLQEAQAAQSRADFIHKMQLALKEAKETVYWLTIVREAGIIQDETGISSLAKEAQEISAILAKSIITAKRNARSNGYGFGQS